MGRRGYTLIEALVSIVLLGIGITGVSIALGAMAKNSARIQQSAQIQRLATMKLAELAATGGAQNGNASGDFTEQDLPNVRWELATQPSGTQDLLVLTLSVTDTNQPDATFEVSTLQYQLPEEAATP
ncbi:MAG: type II secretion system protein [Fimbriimonadaceae bacterium]|nr:type II secretion system protein [Fimbriimonadaceae bacterium]